MTRTCLMTTAFCGTPLRTVSLCLLYIHLFIFLCGVLRVSTNSSHTIYYNEVGGGWVLLFDMIIWILVFSIILGAIITTYRKEPSQFLLFLATIYLYILAFNTVYLTIAVNSDDPEIRDKYKRSNLLPSSESLVIVNVICFACIVFEFYSAVVVCSYREELRLKQKSDYDVPPGQNNPLPPNTQYAAAP